MLRYNYMVLVSNFQGEMMSAVNIDKRFNQIDEQLAIRVIFKIRFTRLAICPSIDALLATGQNMNKRSSDAD